MSDIESKTREKIDDDDTEVLADELDEDEEELGEDEEIDTDAIGLEDGVNYDDDSAKEIRVVDEELSQKELNARTLAIRRAIEQRIDQKRLSEDLDYFDLDLQD